MSDEFFITYEFFMTLYQPFLDHAIATLEARLELTEYPIPEGFESKSAVTGKMKRISAQQKARQVSPPGLRCSVRRVPQFRLEPKMRRMNRNMLMKSR